LEKAGIDGKNYSQHIRKLLRGSVGLQLMPLSTQKADSDISNTTPCSLVCRFWIIKFILLILERAYCNLI